MSKQLNKEFFSEFLKQGNNIGSVMPSSKQLVAKMLEPIDFKNTKCIVELGPGTGVITSEILKKMPPDCILFVFEINKEFCDLLSSTISDPRLKIINDSAEKMEDYLKENNFTKADTIISSLPLALIDEEIVENILKKIKTNLSDSGVFVQYQYSLNKYQKLKELFNKVKLDFVALNFPPAFIFVCKN